MEEGLRRRYLAAMGIPLWLPRDAPAPPPAAEPDGIAAEPAGTRPREPLPSAGLEAEGAAPPAVPAPDLQDPQVETLDWETLAERVRGCRACDELVRNRSRTVFGAGNREAELMLIGEAPGVDEDRQGEPFVGRAGQLLNLMLRACGFRREQVFIANVLKCRPPGNRDPRPEEAQRCAPFLLRQVELIDPKVILSVGRISAQNLLKTDAPVGRLRGRVHYLGEKHIPLVVTYHPAYLLRSPEQKAKAWDDLQLALRTLRQA